MTEKKYFQHILNFDRCLQFRELHQKMGVVEYPKMPEIKFERMVEEKVEHIEILPEEIETEKELRSGEIDLEFDEISIENDFLCHSGRKVAAYIRDQPHCSFVKYGVDPDQGISGYKYHLCNCKTLQNMTAEGRERRYFVTKRNDGLFGVNCMLKPERKRVEVSMELCGYCRNMLSRMNIPTYNFSLAEYFAQHDTYIPKTISRYEIVNRIQDYSDDHKAVAEQCKKQLNYTCQLCGVKCHENRSLLHLHHKNGDKSNNFPNNLEVLCVDCHSKAFMHEHLKKKFSSQIRLISQMRQQQGIVDLEK